VAVVLNTSTNKTNKNKYTLTKNTKKQYNEYKTENASVRITKTQNKLKQPQYWYVL